MFQQENIRITYIYKNEKRTKIMKIINALSIWKKKMILQPTKMLIGTIVDEFRLKILTVNESLNEVYFLSLLLSLLFFLF